MKIKVGEQYKVRETKAGEPQVATITKIVISDDLETKIIYYTLGTQPDVYSETPLGFKIMLSWAGERSEVTELDI